MHTDEPSMFAHTLSGRGRSGTDSCGQVKHAVDKSGGGHMQRALCGREPGRRSIGWSDECEPLTAITCPKCKKLLNLTATDALG